MIAAGFALMFIGGFNMTPGVNNGAVLLMLLGLATLTAGVMRKPVKR